jgi:hypothetical protein
MKLSTETKTAMASQNRLLARSLDILVRRQSVEAKEMLFAITSPAQLRRNEKRKKQASPRRTRRARRKNKISQFLISEFEFFPPS